MNRAEQILASLELGKMSWTELLIEAEEIGESYEQDFDNETTCFEFTDGSVAVFEGIGSSIKTYGCRR